MKIKKNIAVSASGLIFNPDTGESFTVNPMGARIINDLKNGKEQDEIIREVILSHFVEKNTFEKDFEDFVVTLRNYSLIENG